jgi:steroid 5-alpha reductase family enzyme
VLAWLVAAPLAAAIGAPGPLGAVDIAGVVLVLFGIVWETIGDAQLARFKADAANARQVMDRGLWRYSRHPNYFGEFCVWWGFFVIALGAGAWWTVLSPLLLSVLLLRVSGVTLLERDIGERRPAYSDYVARTNAFFPGPPKEI